MKKLLTIATALILAMSMLVFTGCGSEEEAEKAEVNVSAAASLTDALDEIIAEYEKDSDYTITPNYAGSGDLVQQIEGGSPCDIFISASTSNMDQLEEGEFIDSDTRQDMLTNSLVLISTEEMKDTVTMDALTTSAVGTIAIGEPETVPAGKYATQVFENLGITAQVSDKLVNSKDVRAVLNYVSTGDADCGFVYMTDALTEEETVEVIETVSADLHDPIVYPAAILADAPEADGAADFYEFLQSDFAKEVFEKYGFGVK